MSREDCREQIIDVIISAELCTALSFELFRIRSILMFDPAMTSTVAKYFDIPVEYLYLLVECYISRAQEFEKDNPEFGALVRSVSF